MQDNHHLDNDFDKINSLYLDYLKALNSPNNGTLLLQIKEKIVVAFWKTLQKASSITAEMIEHTDVLVKTIYRCLDKCEEFNNPTCFCKITFDAIKKALGAKANTEEFERKSGMHITDPENRKRRKIEKAFKQFNSYKSGDLNKFIEYAVNYLGLKKEDVVEYLFPKQATSAFAQNENNEEYFIPDQYVDKTKVVDIGNEIGSAEELKKQLDAIDALWIEQKEDAKTILSELLTRELLARCIDNKLSYSEKEMLKQAKFICKEMFETFFDDIKYKLPTQQEIGEKYGITKSAVSVKLKRFMERLKER